MTAFARSTRVRLPRLADVAPPLFAWAVGGLLSGYFTSRIGGWYVMSDELQYVKLAVSVGDHLSLTPHLRGEDVGIYSQLYPVLTAPFYAFLSMPAAFDAVHIFNAVVMASAAVPVYILARHLELPKVAATAAATVSVVTPWMLLSTVVMTEALAYPVFVWAILAIQRAVVRPSAFRDLAALGALALAFFARTQFVALVVLYLAVVLLHEVAYPTAAAGRGRRLGAIRKQSRNLLRGHPLLLLAACGVALLPLSGRPYRELLGNYENAASLRPFPPDLLESVAQHVDRVAVGVGVIPLVAALGWALAVAFRPPTKEHHVFALIVATAVPLLSWQVAAFILRFAEAGGVYDRYLFYVAPLLFLGCALLLYAEIRRPMIVATAAVGLGFVVIVNGMNYAPDALFFVDTPTAYFHSVLDGRAGQLGSLFGVDDLSPTPLIQLVALGTAIGLPLALRHLSRAPVAAVVGVAVFAFSAIQCVYIFDKQHAAAKGPNRIGAIGREPVGGEDWIDQRVPDDADVGVVPFPAGPYDEAIWWNVEFWNKTVTRAYSYGETSAYYTPFPEDELWRGPRTSELVTNDRPLARYLVMHREDLRFRPVGRVVAGTPELEAIELEQPNVAGWTSRRFGFQGFLRERGASVRLYGGPGRGTVRRRVTVRLAASPEIDPSVPRAPQLRRRFDMRGPGLHRRGVLRPGGERSETFTVCIPTGSSTRIRLSGTGAGRYAAAPGIRGLPIGVKVASIEVVTVPGSCSAT